MENMQLPTNVISFLAFISFIILFLKAIWRKSTSSRYKLRKLPPSPSKLPLIGHLHHLVHELPHRSLAKLAQKYGPLLHLQLCEVPIIVASSRETAKALLKDFDPACADRPTSLGAGILSYNYQDLAFSPYNDYWKYMRRLCVMELLSAKSVQSFKGIRQDNALRVVELIQSSCGELINLSEKTFGFASSVICRAAFGEKIRDREKLIQFIREGMALAGGFDISDLFPSCKFLHFLSWGRYKLLRMRCELDDILDGIIQEHRDNLAASGKGSGESGADDIIDVLLRIKEGGELEFPITEDNIKGLILNLFAGGVETSAGTVDWAMSELMRNPRVMLKAQTEIREAFQGKMTIDENDVRQLKYLKMVIKETFRLHPAATLLPRACREACEIDGYSIPPKTNIVVNVWAMGQDPSYWHEPQIFNPERFENSSIDVLGNDFEYLPFGAGRRICPGVNFGLANVELLLAQLLYHFNWKLPKGMSASDLDMTEAIGLSVIRKNSLCLIPMRYSATFDG